MQIVRFVTDYNPEQLNPQPKPSQRFSEGPKEQTAWAGKGENNKLWKTSARLAG